MHIKPGQATKAHADWCCSPAAESIIEMLAERVALMHITMLAQLSHGARMMAVMVAVESLARGRTDGAVKIPPLELERCGPELAWLAHLTQKWRQVSNCKNGFSSVSFWHDFLKMTAMVWGCAGRELNFPEDELWGLKMPGCPKI